MIKTKKKNPARHPERRAFLGQLVAAVGGGFVGGSWLRGLLSGRGGNPLHRKKVTISSNPLAVSRTKEGSNSNV